MAPSATPLKGERAQPPPPRSLLPSMAGQRPQGCSSERPCGVPDTTVAPPPDGTDAPVIAVAPHGASGCKSRPSRGVSTAGRAPLQSALRGRVAAAARRSGGARAPIRVVSHPLGSPIRTLNKIHFYERTAGDEPQRTDARRTRDGWNQRQSTCQTIPAPWNAR